MEKAWLRGQLAAGISIEAIAREVGRHPSTVAYWVKKYGLESRHASKHEAKGGVAAGELERLAQEGFSIRDIAEMVGLSYTSTRYWLRKYGIRTGRAQRLAETREAIKEQLAVMTATCHRHGKAQFLRRPDGGFRCSLCRIEAVTERRRRVKSELVAAAGGACKLCGYSSSAAALQFHHLEPSEKSFGIAARGIARSMQAALAEASKCVLLCANCHAEVEAGTARLPASEPSNES